MAKGKVFIKKYIILILSLSYLILSFLLYRYGCYVWTFRKDTKTLLFVCTYMFAFLIGYVIAVKTKIKEQYNNVIKDFSIEKVLLACCIICIIIFFPTCKAYTNSWYPPIFAMLKDPKLVYYSLAEVTKNKTGIRLIGLFDVFAYVLLPLTLWGWYNVSAKVKVSAFCISIMYLLIYLSSGRNISVAVQMISVMAVWISIVFVNKKNSIKGRILNLTILTMIYLVLVIVFFGFTMNARVGYVENFKEQANQLNDANELIDTNKNDTEDNEISSSIEQYITENMEISNEEKKFLEDAKKYDQTDLDQKLGVGQYNYNGLEISKEHLEGFYAVYAVFPSYTDICSKAYVNPNDKIADILPAKIYNVYVMATGYITNGYNCLTVALHSEHKWTYGVGHSCFLSSYLDAFLGTDISNNTYYNRLTNDEKYPLVSKSLWPSLYVQLADDFTFYGVIFVMILIGFVVGKVWMSIIYQNNFVAVLLLGQIILGILFIPANNILGNSGGFFATFWILFLTWVVSTIDNFRFKKQKNISTHKEV